jgi:hypothetical protein
VGSRLIAWEKLSWKGEDNTNFCAKRKWIESEYEAVKQQIEDLQGKKQTRRRDGFAPFVGFHHIHSPLFLLA